MDNMSKDLHELCETLSRSIAAANEKIRAAGGKLSTGDVDYVDKLVHATKSIKAIEKMMAEAELMDDGDYSGRMYSRDYDRSYRGSYGDSSYAPGRGRGRYANRDSMGRYSSRGDDGYSRGGNMADELRDLMNMAPDEQTRQEMQRLISKMENQR